ncbi:DeoR/GlpR family DNA-binding transcription regulator [Brevibacterium sediminis]|uniref:DeoR/GlpR family DNA-binding transcription regulator n=1 Tax=Brevibacterium sediminis TaxID=1857024 RepID=UPI0021750CCA|nr:DeoR/GlpR family DNA-binding transcription regulator [Brevibacterium sediminis]MCS4593518.1 DeoR/GlpR family DNA-binding transcription regulator [Brevibacterium sediminis]
MFAEERQRRIAELVSEAGRVNVTDLAADFDITTETVRRDLAALEKAGALQRVHGGAVPCRPHSLEEPAFDDREIHNLDEKTAIARSALSLLEETMSISVDGGTTCAAFARAIADEAHGRLVAGQAPRQLRVITNSLSAIDSLAGAPGVDIFVLPGRFRPVTRAMVGPQTITAIEGHRVDLAVLGTNGLTGDGVSTPDHDEAATKSAFVQSGRRVAVLADSAKFDAISLVRFAELDQIDVLITDDAPEESLSADLETAEVEVVTP